MTICCSIRFLQINNTSGDCWCQLGDIPTTAAFLLLSYTIVSVTVCYDSSLPTLHRYLLITFSEAIMFLRFFIVSMCSQQCLFQGQYPSVYLNCMSNFYLLCLILGPKTSRSKISEYILRASQNCITIMYGGLSLLWQ